MSSERIPLDEETRRFLEKASIWPRGRNAEGHYVFERTPIDQGDERSYYFAVHPSQLQSGYAPVGICDALYFGGVAEGMHRVRHDIKKALEIP